MEHHHISAEPMPLCRPLPIQLLPDAFVGIAWCTMPAPRLGLKIVTLGLIGVAD
jgi:hypothetical protein